MMLYVYCVSFFPLLKLCFFVFGYSFIVCVFKHGLLKWGYHVSMTLFCESSWHVDNDGPAASIYASFLSTFHSLRIKWCMFT